MLSCEGDAGAHRVYGRTGRTGAGGAARSRRRRLPDRQSSYGAADTVELKTGRPFW
ncbi:hypothetical protein GCM10017778_27880 [Streptomyces vinaceus]|nr:hypothetical protein GCM10017778_27880 [Streptomyces vinaceus]